MAISLPSGITHAPGTVSFTITSASLAGHDTGKSSWPLDPTLSLVHDGGVEQLVYA